MDDLYLKTSFDVSRVLTRNYSTSFFSAVGLLDKDIQDAIFGIYGFVRLADEIVDTFTGYDRARLLNDFEAEYRNARRTGISLNPVINAFGQVVRRYDIGEGLVNAFLASMRADLTKNRYDDKREMDAYVYGSADVVGLMCLRVFCNGDRPLYERLKRPAMKLGSAFQKVNFLRDMKQDMEQLDRAYFPGVTRHNFCEEKKREIIREIETDFAEAFEGIRQLPQNSRLGVYMAYVYYTRLLRKIKRTPARRLMDKRIRVSDFNKAVLFTRSVVMNKVNLL